MLHPPGISPYLDWIIDPSSRTEQGVKRPAGGDGHGTMQLVVNDCLRIESESVEDGRGDVVGTNRLVGRAGAEGIGGAVDLSAADAAAGHQHGLALRPVIAA